MLVRTPWQFDTSLGGAIVGSAGLSGGVTGGVLYLKNEETKERLDLAYGGGGVGIGAGVKIPRLKPLVDLTKTIGAAGASKDFWCGGIGPVWAHNRQNLTKHDFNGLGVIVEFGLGVVVGGAVAQIHFGMHGASLDEMANQFKDGDAPDFTRSPVDIVLQSRACAAIWSSSAGLQAGVALMAYLVNIEVVAG
jgi:hypothetical protein